MRILIVEDDAEIARIVGAMLEKDGFEVGIVGDGESAIEIVTEGSRRPDLLIVDLILPKRSGGDVITAASTTENPPKIIVLSALAESWKRRQHDLSNVVVLSKPVALDLLRMAVRRSLGQAIA